MKLETERLVLRSFRLDDVAAFAEIGADPEVMRYLGPTQDYATAERYLLDCIDRDRACGISRYAVTLPATGELLGFCGFKALEEDQGAQVPAGEPWTDFGWRYRRSSWGQGYGKEAAQALYRWAKVELRLSGVEARAHEDNVASLRIIEGLGFEWLNDYDSPVGRFRRYGAPN